jgi:NhaA family Na+:H+ antiporter
MAVEKNKVRLTIDKLVSPLQKFLSLQAASGVLLFAVAICAMIFANHDLLKNFYFNFINTPISISVGGQVLNKSLLLLVNDGLMAIFFFLIGLEIKREIMVGELTSPRKAAFSLFAALGGMIVPAAIYLLFNLNSGYASGWGVPMATDIAFALGVVTLLGKRVPVTIKVFLLALAIVDDLGAIVIIALFYSGEIATSYLGIAAILMFILLILNYAGLRSIAIGLITGVIVWFCFLKSGVHATIAGVLLAFLTPARPVNAKMDVDFDKELLIDKYIHGLHPWVSFLIMPIFAFFNAGVNLDGISFSQVTTNPVALGVIFGLVIGKPVGIIMMTFVAVKFKLADLPARTNWTQIIGVGFIAGIGFTMSLFISGLAFKGQEVEVYSKVGIIAASLSAMALGYFILLIGTRTKKNKKI